MQKKIVLAMEPRTGDMVRVKTRAEAEYHKANGDRLFVMTGETRDDAVPAGKLGPR